VFQERVSNHQKGDSFMETTRTPITPVRQAFVEIAGHRVLAFVLPSGQIAAAFRMICNMLGVDHRRQVRRVQADSAIAEHLLLVKVEIVGATQEMNVIVAEAIPLWLASIHESKVAPEARETLAEFQRVAVETLRAFFFPETREPPKHSAPPKPEAQPLPPPEEAPSSIPALLRALADRIEQEQHVLAEQQASRDREHNEEMAYRAEIQRRLRLLEEEQDAAWVVITANSPAAPGALNGEHQRTLHLLLHALHLIAGKSIAALEEELAALMHVADVHQIQETAWDRVFAWLWQRLKG
jgi:hypothetical protein